VLTAATDVWGIGATLFAAATGAPPFSEDPDDGDRHPQLEQRAAPVRSRRRLPPAVAGVIDGCLERDPGDRPTVADVHTALEAFAMARLRRD
jgi:serine/threonine protein kinase